MISVFLTLPKCSNTNGHTRKLTRITDPPYSGRECLSANFINTNRFSVSYYVLLNLGRTIVVLISIKHLIDQSVIINPNVYAYILLANTLEIFPMCPFSEQHGKIGLSASKQFQQLCHRVIVP